MLNAKQKGGNYEREICKMLSFWWTNGERDDVFWRSQTSGARATVRSKAGLATAGNYGDVAATDPIGEALIKVATIEVKRGYSTATPFDVIDAPAGAGVGIWEEQISQAYCSHKQAGSYSWLLISKRNRRESLVWMPYRLYGTLKGHGAWTPYPPTPLVHLRVRLRMVPKQKRTRITVVGTSLESWLKDVFPEHVQAITEDMK